MLKHGFLITAHAYFPQLERIIALLTSSNHYFFINIDKKAIDGDGFMRYCKQEYSHVFFLEGNARMEVAHGGYTQVECFIRLLKYASQNDMDYFHFISGQDYPCRPNDDFDNFFEKNVGRSYMHFDNEQEGKEWQKEKYLLRVKPYWFNDIPHRDYSIVNYMVKILNKVSHHFLWRKDIPNLWGGWNWVSWHKTVVNYVLTQERDNLHFFNRFHHTICCDELIFVTMLRPVAEKLNIETNNSLRYINWTKKADGRSSQPSPLILNEEEYEDIIKSGAFFCRKIHPKVSSKLIDLLEKNVKAVGNK